MPRHAFRFSRRFLDELRAKIESAFNGLEPERFRQEPAYTSAILGRLHGIEVSGVNGEHIRIQMTDVDDRGRDSAESRYGADFAITATVSDLEKTVKKSILVQVKNQPIDELPNSQLNDLKKQIKKIQTAVPSPKVAGIRREKGKAMLEVSSGNRVVSDEPYMKSDFPSYFNQRVITTLDGCTDESIVSAIQDSNLRGLDVIVKSEFVADVKDEPNNYNK